MTRRHEHDRKTARPHRAGGLWAVGAALAAILGCGDRDPVHSYTVPKEAVQAAAVPATPSMTPEPDAAIAPAVMQFELPPGWESVENPNTMRFATLVAGTGDERVEIAVTQLGGAAGGVAANVNRWRGQIGLAPQSDAEIAQSAEPVGSGDAAGVWVDLAGPDPHGGDGDGLRMFAAIFPRGPDTWFVKAVGPSALLASHRDAFAALCESVSFASAANSAAAPESAPPPATENAAPAGLAWGALPGGWTADASPAAMSVASFTVSGGGQEASVTITPLGGRQDALANVNRWRRQVGLGPLAALADEPPAPIRVAGAAGGLVDVAGSGGHILAVMTERDGSTWFVKMSGPDPLVADGRAGFEAFVGSLRFDGGHDE